MIVDAHQHFWRVDRSDYGWLQPQLGALYRDYLPQHLAPLLKANDVSATVLVQAAATEDETHYLLELAATCPFVAAVVGWVELDAPNAPERIRALVGCSGGRLKGLRPMLQDIADPNWTPEFEQYWWSLTNPDGTIRPAYQSLLDARTTGVLP